MPRQVGSHRSRSILRSADGEHERSADLEATVRRLLEQLGEDANRSGLEDTPKRVAKLCRF